MKQLRTYDVEVITRDTWLGTVVAASPRLAQQAAREAYNQNALKQIDAKFIRILVEEVRS